MKKEVVIVLLIFLIAFSFRLLILMHSDNFQGAIPMEKVIRAIKVSRNPGAKEHKLDNQPLFSYIIGGALRLWNNPLITPRVVCLLFGSLLIFPYFYFIKLILNSEMAIFSSILVAAYPFHVIQSTLSMVEVPFHFFLFSSFFFFFHFKKKREKRLPFLVLSAICLTMACVIRYEGWIFVPLLTLFLLKERPKYILLFVLIAMVFPGFTMLIHWQAQGDPLHVLHVSDSVVVTEIAQIRRAGSGLARHYATFLNKLLSWPAILTRTILPFVVILGFLGLGYSLIKRRHLYLAALFLTLFFLFTYKVINETFLVQPRYALTLGLLLIPFSILALDTPLTILKKKWRYGLMLIFILFIFGCSIKYAIDKRPIVPQFVKDLGAWFNKHAALEDKVLIDVDEWQLYQHSIIFYSGLSPDNMTTVPWKIMYDNHRVADKTTILQYLRQEKPRFILYSSQGYLPGIFHFSRDNQVTERFGFVFNLVYEGGPYRIYEVSPKPGL